MAMGRMVRRGAWRDSILWCRLLPVSLRLWNREGMSAQAAVVRRVFALAAEGHRCRRITNVISAEGVPAPGPKGWSGEVHAERHREVSVCGGPLLYVGKGPGREKSYYCGTRVHRGSKGRNGAGVPIKGY